MADIELTAKMIGMEEARKSLSHLVSEVKTKNARYLLSRQRDRRLPQGEKGTEVIEAVYDTNVIVSSQLNALGFH
ncbi:MAG: hypothetical protein ACE5OR_01410 [bacterium]